MTAIDAVRQPGTVLLDGATLDLLDALSVATGRTPAELVAFLVAAAPISTPVDAGHPPAPGSPDVEPGQGEAQPPAPTAARVLGPLSGPRPWLCRKATSFTDPCRKPARWMAGRRTGNPADLGPACCDDHIPDGWVRPDEVIALTQQRPAPQPSTAGAGHDPRRLPMAHLRTTLAFTGHGDAPTPTATVWPTSDGPYAEARFVDSSGHEVALSGPVHQVYAALRDAMNAVGNATDEAIELVEVPA